MSSTVLLEKAVVTDTAIAAEKATEKALKSILPKWQDRVTAKLLIRSININVLKPILEEKPNKLAKTFEDSVELFGITMIPLEQLVLKNNRDNLQSIMNSESAFYQEGTKSLYRREGWISETNLDQIREIISIFQDYQNVILGILMKHRDLPANSLAAMNQEEWLTSLYGTILAIFCIFKLVNTRKYQDQRKLGTLIAVGKKYAEKLDGYSDTIDILTNPEEMELIRRAEKL